ncbi:2-oxoglutarate dehydrogenase, E1 component [Artemisia annua]|uniref:2-oxoglutarate dehydrogenase, E1 component n=1 Tax=Artemisia annua TaxID=35608 RepID=A0A2U1M1N3_ARTAN|nr:2-oxoglutarate dehydrogenase, E1 component [Artemisia annua]
MLQQPPVEDESWKGDLARVFHKMPTNIREGIYNQMPDDVKAYLDKAPQPYAVDDDEFIAARAWRDVLEYKGLPLDTPYRYKTYSETTSVSYLESYCDRLYNDLRAKKGNLEASSSSSSAAEIVYNYRHPPKPKPKPPFRVLEESEDEDYKDYVHELVYGKKRRQLDAEALRKQKLRKPKRFKSYNGFVYADEDSKKKRDDKIKAHRKMRMQRYQQGNGYNQDSCFKSLMSRQSNGTKILEKKTVNRSISRLKVSLIETTASNVMLQSSVAKRSMKRWADKEIYTITTYSRFHCCPKTHNSRRAEAPSANQTAPLPVENAKPFPRLRMSQIGMIDATIWDDDAISFNKEAVATLPSPVIVDVTSMKVTLFQGVLQLNATPGSYVSVNPENEESTIMAVESLIHTKNTPSSILILIVLFYSPHKHCRTSVSVWEVHCDVVHVVKVVSVCQVWSGSEYWGFVKELDKQRKSLDSKHLTICRVEQQCPFPYDLIQRELKCYPNPTGSPASAVWNSSHELKDRGVIVAVF